MSRLARFRAGGLEWTAQEGFRPALEPLAEGLADPDGPEGGVPVKRSMARAVWRLWLGGRSVYVKRYRLRGAAERIKYRIAAPRAIAEWRAAWRLREFGIDAAEPLAVGIRRSRGGIEDAFFVAAEVPGIPYADCLPALRARAEGVAPLVACTVALLTRLRRAGVVHRDLHTGNLIVKLTPEGPRLGLVDLHSVRFRILANARPQPRVRARLAHSLSRVLREEEFTAALSQLAPGREPALRRRVERLERRRLRSRSARCVRESTAFSRERVAGWTLWRRRTADRAALLELTRSAPATVRKVVLEEGDGRREVVARRRERMGWLGTWRGLHALSVREIPTFRAHACLQRTVLGRVREALLVVDHHPDALPLERAVATRPGRADELVDAALATAERLHRHGLSAHARDLYAVPDDEGWCVLRAPYEGRIPDRPLAEDRVEQERSALRALSRNR